MPGNTAELGSHSCKTTTCKTNVDKSIGLAVVGGGGELRQIFVSRSCFTKLGTGLLVT